MAWFLESEAPNIGYLDPVAEVKRMLLCLLTALVWKGEHRFAFTVMPAFAFVQRPFIIALRLKIAQ